jgi:hypothetical protein
LLQRKTSSAGSSRLGAGSDGRRSLGARSAGTGSSDSGAGSDKGSQLNPSGGDGKQPPLLAAVNMASMYDSLAAELREKLGGGNKQQPLLLPPRDYDTVHRSRGNIVGIEARRSLNPRIVGGVAAVAAKNIVGGEDTTAWNGGRIDHNSSGHSSGIGSDTAPSPPLQEFPPDPDDGRSSSGNGFLKTK